MAVGLILLIFGCILITVVLLALGAGVIIIMKSGERDVVSQARQGWINRRSEKDQEGW